MDPWQEELEAKVAWAERFLLRRIAELENELALCNSQIALLTRPEGEPHACPE